jgi:hypothetical protein
MAWGNKLFRVLLVPHFLHRYYLPWGSRENSLWLRGLESLKPPGIEVQYGRELQAQSCTGPYALPSVVPCQTKRWCSQPRCSQWCSCIFLSDQIFSAQKSLVRAAYVQTKKSLHFLSIKIASNWSEIDIVNVVNDYCSWKGWFFLHCISDQFYFKMGQN